VRDNLNVINTAREEEKIKVAKSDLRKTVN
jgi:hypothetical protein